MAHLRLPLNSNFLTGIRDFRVPLSRFPLNSNFSAAFLLPQLVARSLSGSSSFSILCQSAATRPTWRQSFNSPTKLFSFRLLRRVALDGAREAVPSRALGSRGLSRRSRWDSESGPADLNGTQKAVPLPSLGVSRANPPQRTARSTFRLAGRLPSGRHGRIL